MNLLEIYMLDMLKVIVWASAIVIVLFMYRSPITRFIDRTQKVSLPKGIEVTTTEDQLERARNQKPLEALTEGEPAVAINEVEAKRASIGEEFQNPMLVEQARRIEEALDSLALDNAADREELLVKHLAASQIACLFEQTYRLIFGSQINALHFLAQESMNGTADIESLRPVYLHAENYGLDHSRVSFEAWLEFLEYCELVQKTENEIAITPRGKEFLRYLLERGYAYKKGW